MMMMMSRLSSTRSSLLLLALSATALLTSAIASAYSTPRTPTPTSRRQWIATSTAFVAATAGLAPAWAVAAEQLQTFNDPTHNFSIQLPQKWTFQGEQKLVDRRRLLVWTDPNDAATAVFIAYTPVRDDYTSLGSFGSVDQVAAQTILPKSKIMDESSDTSATMLKAESRQQSYRFDYKQKIAGVQPETHYRTIFALQPIAGNAGSVLVTITAQTPESNYATVRPTLDAIVESFGKSV